jgi:transposase-like protein
MEIVALYKTGKTDTEIARKFGLCNFQTYRVHRPGKKKGISKNVSGTKSGARGKCL